MGIPSALEIFQEVMNQVLGDLDYTTLYVDVVLILFHWEV